VAESALAWDQGSGIACYDQFVLLLRLPRQIPAVVDKLIRRRSSQFLRLSDTKALPELVAR
jgi:hypothetical protein